DMVNSGNGQVRLAFKVPSRGLIGYSTEFMTQTHGYGIMNHTFEAYEPAVEGDVGGRRQGVLVGMEAGKASTYSILQLEDLGTIFVEPGTEIYAGMIGGEHNREYEMTVNITKEKLLTTMRSAHKDQTTSKRSTT